MFRNKELNIAVSKYYKYCNKYYSSNGSPLTKKILYDKMEEYRKLTFNLFKEEYKKEYTDTGTDWW